MPCIPVIRMKAIWKNATFIDSTPLKACHNRRICSRKVFSGLAGHGNTSTGWFCGFKLRLVVNEHGEILSFLLTAGNVDDRNANVIDRLAGNWPESSPETAGISPGSFSGGCTGKGFSR